MAMSLRRAPHVVNSTGIKPSQIPHDPPLRPDVHFATRSPSQCIILIKTSDATAGSKHHCADLVDGNNDDQYYFVPL
jgi:hypothetical protein